MSKEALKKKQRYNYEDLVELVDILCAPDGCPWDNSQTHQSIRNNLIEETYEAVEGIDKNDPTILTEELGDVLLQVVMHCKIAEKAGTFSKEDVLTNLCKKLIFRHPHLFANDYTADSPDQALANWEALKKQEKGYGTPQKVVSSVSPALPALLRAQKLNAKAYKNGIISEFASAADVSIKAKELEQAVLSGDKTLQNKALGELLFTACSCAADMDINAEQSLFGKNVEFCENICANCSQENENI